MLALVRDIRPGGSRLAHCQRMQEYGFIRQDVLTLDWAGAPLKFWSAAICRVTAGVYEHKDDEEELFKFVSTRGFERLDNFGACSEGWTFVFNQMQGAAPALQRLHHAVWASTGISGGINAYLTPGFAVGKSPHVDEHDVFVVQLHGSKQWTLFEDDMRTPLHQCVLAPGAVLYLPQGLPHQAHNVFKEPSLHLSVSVSRSPFTGAGLLAAWLERHSSGGELGERMQGWPTREAAKRIEARRACLASSSGPRDALRQLPGVCHSTLVLRAFHVEDMPAPDTMSLLTAELVELAERALEGLLSSSSAELRQQGADLAAALAQPRSRVLEEVADTVWALREFHFEEHYMIHLPLALPSKNRKPDLGAGQRFRRAPDAAALLLRDGSLNVNGYRLLSVAPAVLPALRFAMGVNTGASLAPFLAHEVPGAAGEALSLLLRLGGLEQVAEFEAVS